MRRSIFGEEHDLFRAQFRRFAEAEIQPRIADWNARGVTDRETWRRVGEQGFLGLCAPEEYGGAGADYTYAAIVHEELATHPGPRAHGSGCTPTSVCPT